MDLIDIFQQFRIERNRSRVNDVGRQASDATFEAGKASISVNYLEDRVDQLSLVCMAMCELMEEIGFNKNMLEAKIREIDLRDGKLDGKFVEKKVCSGCSREVAARHLSCLYCGTTV
jgi:hypothetical protein